MNKRLILIISYPRSGTNALADILKKYFPNCYYEGEIFGGGIEDQSLDILKKEFPEIVNLVHQKQETYHACEIDGRNCIESICDKKNEQILSRMLWMEKNYDRVVETLLKNRGNVTIIKICSGQLSPESIEKIVDKFNPKVIILRRIIFFSYVSRIKALINDTWTDYITSDIKYQLKENKISGYMDRINNWYTSIYKIFKNKKTNYIDLTFSELFESDQGFIKLNDLMKDWKYENSPDGIIYPDTKRQDVRTDKSLLFMLEQFTELSKDCQEKVLKLPGED